MSTGDLEPGDQIAAICPVCQDDRPGAHDVLSPGTSVTIRCRTCDHVHKTRMESPKTSAIRVIISMDGESIKTTADVPMDEELAVGEEFVTETDEAILGVRITSLELSESRRVSAAPAAEVETIWTRAVDNVTVNATIHPADGSREGTTSEPIQLPGDEVIQVGDELEADTGRIVVEGIRIRDDATGYTGTQINSSGTDVLAKDIARVYARTVGGDTWSSAWDDL